MNISEFNFFADDLHKAGEALDFQYYCLMKMLEEIQGH